MLSATVGLPIFVLDGIETRLNFICLLRNVHVTAGNSHVVRRAGLVPFGRLVQLTAYMSLRTRFDEICSADPRRAPHMRLRTGIKLGAGVSSIPATWQQGGVLPLDGHSSSSRPALGGPVTPPHPLRPQFVFQWHLLSNSPSAGLI